MIHEEYQEMLAAQALNALDAKDARSLQAHLLDCADCRSQLSGWEDTAVCLSFATQPCEPSPQLRDRIMQSIRADSADYFAESGRTVSAAATTARGSNVIALPQRRTWSATQTWGAIAAGLVFVALSAALFVLWKQNTAAREELARLTDQVREAQQQIARQQEAIEIVASPGARMSELAGTKMMPGAHAMLAYDKNGRAILMAKGLPPAPDGMAYQLWFIAGGKPMPGKVFSTDASGAGTLNDHIPVEALTAAVFAITMEPKSGVTAPTGAIYLSSGS